MTDLTCGVCGEPAHFHETTTRVREEYLDGGMGAPDEPGRVPLNPRRSVPGLTVEHWMPCGHRRVVRDED